MTDHTAHTAIQRLLALADQWDREARTMSIAAGDSPRPLDYSEGHYVATLKHYREHAALVRQIITTTMGDTQ